MKKLIVQEHKVKHGPNMEINTTKLFFFRIVAKYNMDNISNIPSFGLK